MACSVLQMLLQHTIFKKQLFFKKLLVYVIA